MFDNGSFLRRRKRYKRTSLTHGVPFPSAVFSPFSPFWVRKPVPVFPIPSFGSSGFSSGFQENFDVFNSANECFENRANSALNNKINSFRDRDNVIKPEVIYDNRVKLEFLRRNMDAFRKNNATMDLFAHHNHDGVSGKSDFLDNLSRNSHLLSRNNDSRNHPNGGSIETDHSDANAINYFCYDNDELSNDKIDVVNAGEENSLNESEPMKSIRNASICKSETPNSAEKENKSSAFVQENNAKENDEKLFRVYTDFSPEHNLYSSRSSNASAEFLDVDNEKQLWQNDFQGTSIKNKKFFETTVLDYDFSQKRRKYGNAKGFSIENLIGRAVEES